MVTDRRQLSNDLLTTQTELRRVAVAGPEELVFRSFTFYAEMLKDSRLGQTGMGLLAIQRLGRNGETPRLWVESQRLEALGFSHGVPLHIERKGDGLVLRPAILGENHVSSRAVPTGRRPIIDLASQSLLANLSRFSELKILASFERIEVTPSHRAFAIQRSRLLRPPLRVLEVFTGGGTMTAALDGEQRFQIVGGIEINPPFSDEWQAKNPSALLIQSDIRSVHVSDLPEYDVMIGGIPCTSHSTLGRAKHGLAGRPEAGDAGDLFLPVLSFIADRMPAALVFENVPAFASSLAAELMINHLRRIGYHVFTTILRPNDEWNEIEDRRRWLMVATLDSPFHLKTPNLRCTAKVSEYLDAANQDQDRLDAGRVELTIEGLRAHNARHEALGHGFAFTEVNGSETRLPTIPKSHHKINTGPFVETAQGLRLLRQDEIERIHGCNLKTRDYATAVQILGQGVQTRIFRSVFRQLADHLVPPKG